MFGIRCNKDGTPILENFSIALIPNEIKVWILNSTLASLEVAHMGWWYHDNFELKVLLSIKHGEMKPSNCKLSNFSEQSVMSY